MLVQRRGMLFFTPLSFRSIVRGHPCIPCPLSRPVLIALACSQAELKIVAPVPKETPQLSIEGKYNLLSVSTSQERVGPGGGIAAVGPGGGRVLVSSTYLVGPANITKNEIILEGSGRVSPLAGVGGSTTMEYTLDPVQVAHDHRRRYYQPARQEVEIAGDRRDPRQPLDHRACEGGGRKAQDDRRGRWRDRVLLAESTAAAAHRIPHCRDDRWQGRGGGKRTEQARSGGI